MTKQKQKPTDKFSWADSVLKYLFAATLIFVPLYPKFPMFAIPGSSVAIRTEDFLIFSMLLVMLLRLPQVWKLLVKDDVQKMAMVFLLVGLVSLLSGIYMTSTTDLKIGLLHWGRRVEYLIPFFVGSYLVQKRQEMMRFSLEILLVVSLGVFAWGIGQIYFKFPVISTQNEEFSKGLALTLAPGVNLSSTFAGHYDLAGFLVMTILLLLPVYLGIKSKIKFINLVILTMLYWLFLQTGSRIAFGALVLCVPIVLFMAKKKLWIFPVMIVMAIFAVNAPNLLGRFSDVFRILQFSTLQEKVKGAFDTRGYIVETVLASETTDLGNKVVSDLTPTTTTDLTPTPTQALRPVQQDRSTSIRIDVEWPRAIRAFTKSPILGTGYNSITLATDNDYLRALGETGILGLVSLVLLLAALLIRVIKASYTVAEPSERMYLIGWTGAIIAVLMIATFIDIFEASKNALLFWAYSGIANGIYEKSKK